MGNADKGGKGKALKGGKGLRGKYAFKVLCPDALVTCVIGPRGSFKDQLEEQTGCKLVISNRDQYFPGSHFRILVISGPEVEAVAQVLEKVIEKIGECGDLEMQNPPNAEPDFLGKEGGEYLLRALISTKMATSIIGPKGGNVQAIRQETNAKVFIDNTHYQGHQVVKVVGSLESLQNAALKVHECVQTHAEEPWFRDWSMTRYLAEAGEAPAHGERERSPRRGGAQITDQCRGADAAAATAGTQSREVASEVEQLAQAMTATSQEFPEGALDADFTITSHLPSDKVSALIGKKGDHVKHVKRVTGANVLFQPDPQDPQLETLVVKGPLFSIYKAHALLMKRYQETEEPPPPDPRLVDDLQAQLDSLQKQLAAAKASKGRQGKKGGKKGA